MTHHSSSPIMFHKEESQLPKNGFQGERTVVVNGGLEARPIIKSWSDRFPIPCNVSLKSFVVPAFSNQYPKKDHVEATLLPESTTFIITFPKDATIRKTTVKTNKSVRKVKDKVRNESASGGRGEYFPMRVECSLSFVFVKGIFQVH